MFNKIFFYNFRVNFNLYLNKVIVKLDLIFQKSHFMLNLFLKNLRNDRSLRRIIKMFSRQNYSFECLH